MKVIYIVATEDISGALYIHGAYLSKQSADNEAEKMQAEEKWLVWTVLELKINDA